MNILSILTTVLNFVCKHKTLFLALLCASLFACLSISIKKYKDAKADAERLSINQNALLSDIDSFKTASGKNAIRVTELELTKGEFEKLCAEQVKTINDLGLKVKRLESISTTVTNTKVNATVNLKDTVIYTVTDTIVKTETLKHFKWNDTWNEIEGTIKDDKVNCSYTGMDTLNIVATRVPKKFLFFKWGCKYVEVNIVNQNPSSRIIYNRTIKLKKK